MTRVKQLPTPQITQFLYQKNRLIGLYENGAITHLKVGSNATEESGQPYLILTDYRGNVARRKSLDSLTNEGYTYDAFGGNSTSSSNPWRFLGQYLDPDLNLYLIGKRFYSSTLGRWITPDPGGYIDGPNLYAYAHNRPLTCFDLTGLLTQDRNERPGFLRTIRDIFANFTFRRTPLSERPVRFHPFEAGRECKSCIFHSEGIPFSKDAEISVGNGINTTLEEMKSRVDWVSKIADNHQITGIYNATHGMRHDLEECGLGLDYIATESTEKMVQNINSFHERASPEGKMFYLIISQAAINMRNALLSVSKEARWRVNICAISPAVFIDKKLCHSVTHYVSFRDPIPLRDLSGMVRNWDNIRFLKHHPDASWWFDHSFDSPTFEKAIETEIKDYIENYGGE